MFVRLVRAVRIRTVNDNGQVEISKLLSSVFNALLPEVQFKRVMPENYKLFQAADLFCSIELVSLKMDANAISKSEEIFFGNMRDVKPHMDESTCFLLPARRPVVL